MSPKLFALTLLAATCALALPARADSIDFPPSCSDLVHIPECTSSDDCPAESPYCDDFDDGTCVQCQADSDCPEGTICVQVEYDGPPECTELCSEVEEDTCPENSLCVKTETSTSCLSSDGGIAAATGVSAPASSMACLGGALALLLRRRRHGALGV
ncbi:MAG: hypothetical protein IT383_16195 [Deltaproteobacteria bacterium]|nr:hypothetical protein [Deltaproteobacteria bacterium]